MKNKNYLTIFSFNSLSDFYIKWVIVISAIDFYIANLLYHLYGVLVTRECKFWLLSKKTTVLLFSWKVIRYSVFVIISFEVVIKWTFFSTLPNNLSLGREIETIAKSAKVSIFNIMIYPTLVQSTFLFRFSCTFYSKPTVLQGVILKKAVYLNWF